MESATNSPAANGKDKGKNKKQRDYGDRKFKSPFKVHVGNLPCSANMVTLSQYFASVKPSSIAIATSMSVPYECAGYAFLGFPTSTYMVACRDVFHESEFMGREISVKLTGENVYIDDPMQREGLGANAGVPGGVITAQGERPEEGERPQTADATQATEYGLQPGQAGGGNPEEDEGQDANVTPQVTGDEPHASQTETQEEKPEEEKAAPKADITIPVEEGEPHPTHAEEEKPAEGEETQAAEASQGGDGEKARKAGKKAKKPKRSKNSKLEISKITAPVTEDGGPAPSRAEGEEKPEGGVGALQAPEEESSPGQAGEETPGGEGAEKADVAAPAVQDELHPSQTGEKAEEGKKVKKPKKSKDAERAKKGRKPKTAASAPEGGPSPSRAGGEGKPEKEPEVEESKGPKIPAVAQGSIPLPNRNEEASNPEGGQSAEQLGAIAQDRSHPNLAGSQDKPKKETRAEKAKMAAESGGFLLRASHPGDEMKKKKPKETAGAKDAKLKAKAARDDRGYPHGRARAEKKPEEDESVKKAKLAAQAVLGLDSAWARARGGKPRVKRKAGEEEGGTPGKKWRGGEDFTMARAREGKPRMKRKAGEEAGEDVGKIRVPPKKHRS